MLRVLFGFIFCILTVSSLMAAEPLQIVIEGLEGDVLENVETALVPPTGLVREDKVEVPWLERFEREAPERVRQAMEPFGYYSPQVETSVEVTEEGTYVMKVNVDPGQRVHIAEVHVKIQGPGINEPALNAFVTGFPLKVGDPLLHTKYEEAKGAFLGRCVDLGYLDAAFSVHEIRVSKAKARASLALVLDTGSQFRFGEITFGGAPEYPESFLRRHLEFQSGGIFSYKKMNLSSINFARSDRFAEVYINADKALARDFFVPVKITLKPSDPKRFRVGGGYQTDYGPIFSSKYQDVNFLYRGHEVNAELNVSPRLQGLGVGYTWPATTDFLSKTSLSLKGQHENIPSYDSRTISSLIEYTRNLLGAPVFGRERLGSGYLQLQGESYTIGEEDSRSWLVMPGVRFSERHYDDLVRPRRAFNYSLDLRGTHRALGSDTEFLQFTGYGKMLFPLPYRFSLSMRGQFGTTLQGDSFESLPPSVRFFAGGDNSVRGYDYKSLGPRDDQGNVVGGKHLLVGSVEIEKAIGKVFGLAAFYDVGNAFDNVNEMNLQQGAGIGIRLYAPFGYLRFDFARQLNVRDPDYRIHFAVGIGL
ncbi:MAG: hypothetical protein A2170_07905 [Deltaproteobacteria bacterium RBG_13_53_10]|nr:MAG: hypothetical protein A2170_07905 [Deltaproteobacteria bacterium RBG_13_53_10]